jgi:Protein of unknown function (DUF3619)
MNEQQFSLHVRRALDESAEKLPFKVTHRLGAARELALSRLGDTSVSATPLGFAGLAPVLAQQSAGRSLSFSSGSSTWWRLAGTVLPLLIVALGLVSMHAWDLSAKAEELAEVDAEMLSDEVPIDTYADRGFGVFLKNTRQP